MESIWNRTCSISPRDSLKEDRKAETVIIGAGMTGILTAYLLKKRGISSIILEAGRIGGGQTGNTTAKITSQHGAIYEKLIREYGKEQAFLYGIYRNGKGFSRTYCFCNSLSVDQCARLSFRNYENLLLAGGGGHRTGENRGGGKYNAIRRKAEKYFPDARETACWSAQDCVTHDRIQFAGQQRKILQVQSYGMRT